MVTEVSCKFPPKNIPFVKLISQATDVSERFIFERLKSQGYLKDFLMGYAPFFNRTFAYEIYYYGIHFYEIYFYSSILLQTVYTSP